MVVNLTGTDIMLNLSSMFSSLVSVMANTKWRMIMATLIMPRTAGKLVILLIVLVVMGWLVRKGKRQQGGPQVGRRIFFF